MKKSLLTLLVCSTALAAIPALAEEKKPSNQLPAVVVTATGQEEEYNKLPVTVDTVTPQQAEQAKPSWIGELLNQEPGVLASRLRGSVDVFSIRQPTRFDNVYLYLQDNVPIQSAVNFNHAAFSYSSALTSPGGIEILKGPGTALYGTDAFAGVINIKSRMPDFLKRETETEARAGSYGFREGRIEHNQPINDEHAIRAAFSHQEEDGWRDTTDWSREQFLLRHSFKNNDDLKINNVVTYTDLDSSMAAALDAATFHSNPKSDGLDPQVSRSEAKDLEKLFLANSEIVKDLSDHTSISVTPYVRMVDQQYMATWQPATTPVTESETDSFGLLNKFYYDYANGAQTILGFDIDRTQHNTMETQSRPDQVVFGSLYPQGLHFDYRVDYTSYAPFIQHSHPLTDRLTATVGLRYEYSQYDFDNHLAEVAGDAFLQLPDRKDTFKQLNPKFGLSYALTDTDNIFFRYAHGFRIPAAYELYNLSSSQTSFSLDPEKVDSYEVGYKGIVGNNIALGSSVYYMKTTDGISVGVASPAGDISENGGETEFYGIEGSAGVPLGKEFDLNLSLALQRSEVIKKFKSTASAADGNEAVGAPQTLGNVRLGYTPAWLDNRFRGEVEAQHIGEWYLDDANTLDTPNVFLVNLRSEYALTETASIDFKVINLFDKIYASTAEAPVWEPGGLYRPGAPLTVTAGVKLKF